MYCNKKYKKRFNKKYKIRYLKFFMSFFIFIVNYNKRCEKMANKKENNDKRQIHPVIDKETENILILFDVKPSQALKNYANHLKSDTTKIDSALNSKTDYLNLLESHKEFVDKEIIKTKNEIEQLEKRKNEAVNEQLSNYEKAIKIIDERFKEIETDLNDKWGVQKMPIKELESIALEYCIPAEILLKNYPRSRLKKVLENYRKYS